MAAVLNELAFAIGSVVLALLIYRRTGSAVGATAFFLCSQFVPAFISPFLVARLDQRSSRYILGFLYTLEGLIFLGLAGLVDRFSLPLFFALVLLDGALFVTARVLARAAWTSLTNPLGLLREANAVINTAFAAAFMLGPAIGGAVVGLDGTVVALLLNAGLFGAMALGVATSRSLPRAVADPVPTAGRVRAALGRARADRSIRRLLSLQALGWLFFTVSIPVEVVFARHSLHSGAAGYGFLLSAWGGGGLVGSAIYGRWREVPSRYVMTFGTCFFGAGFLIMAVAPSLAIAIVGSAVAGVGNGLQIVAFRTALQEATPERWMALILSLAEVIFEGVPGAGILLGGAIAALAGPRPALAVGAFGSLIVAAAMWVGLKSPQNAEKAEILDATDVASAPSEGLTFAAREP